MPCKTPNSAKASATWRRTRVVRPGLRQMPNQMRGRYFTRASIGFVELGYDARAGEKVARRASGAAPTAGGAAGTLLALEERRKPPTEVNSGLALRLRR